MNIHPNEDVGVLEKTEKTEQSEEVGELALALSKAQGMITGALKDSANPFFKSKYADLASVWDACREGLSKNELAVIQTTSGDCENVTIITTLVHSSGQWIRGSLTIKPAKPDAQAVGSVITYGRRYGLAAITGVAQVDDDGNAAVDAKKPTVKISKKVKDEFYKQCIECLGNADESGLDELWSEHDTDTKVVLWGLFNSQERSAMKKLMSKENL